MTAELERIKILEGKISQVVDHINRMAAENEKLKAQVKELRAEKAKHDDQVRRVAKLEEERKRFEDEREAVRAKVEALISQIDALGL